MPIPPLNEQGLLPIGIFECALDEVKIRFGNFQSTDRRPLLFVRLLELVAAMRKSELFECFLLDGSFVTTKPSPNDVDLMAVLRSGHNFERDLPMSEYALVSRNLLNRRFGFDVIVAEPDSQLYRTYVEFFSRVRETTELQKGLLRLKL